MGVQTESLGMFQRTPHYQHPALPGVERKSAAPDNGLHNGRSWREHKDTGIHHFSQNINFICAGGSKEQEIIRLNRNILREVPMLKEALKIHRHALAISNQI